MRKKLKGIKPKTWLIILVVGLLIVVGAYFAFFWGREIKIVTSFPMRGVTAGQEIVNGIKLAFEENGYKAGGYDLELVIKDEGDEMGRWHDFIEADNAREAANDSDVMVYLGAYNSGASKISIPINNRAGIVQIAPSNTWPGLTLPGFMPGEPGTFYPTGVRNYFRVAPTDLLQGSAGAIWAQELGAKNVYIFDDGDAYGKGIADIFEQKSLELGLNVVGHKSIDRTAFDFTDDVNELKGKDVDLIYFGGVTANGALYLIQNIRTLLGSEIKFMGPDGLMDQSFIDQSKGAAEGTYMTHVGVSPNDFTTEKGKKFYADYKARFNEEPGSWSAFGYEAAKVVLLSIERAGVKDRARILEEMSKIRDYDGLFGTWSFDENGDTTLKVMSANIVINGEFVFQRLLER